MLNLEKVKEELNKWNFNYKNNIVLEHTTYKVKWVLPAGPVIVIASESATSYLFGFDEKGIHVFPVEGNWNILDCCLIEWENITKFAMKKGILLENTMNITTNEMKLALKINKMIKEKYLYELNKLNLEKDKLNTKDIENNLLGLEQFKVKKN